LGYNGAICAKIVAKVHINAYLWQYIPKPMIMKIKIILALGLLTASLCVSSAQVDAPEAPLAAITFEQSSYDFGTVEDGAKVTQIFTFTNTSDEPLVIYNVKGSCGCTVPSWPRAVISPGETASLTAEFDSKNKTGKRNQKIVITANTNPPQTFIHMTGEVLPATDPPRALPAAEQAEPVHSCLTVSPNPARDIFRLDLGETAQSQQAIISIHSLTGQLMAKREIPSVDGPAEFSVAHYPAGTYFASVQIADRKPQSSCFVVAR
jgi:hypothetical protein